MSPAAFFGRWTVRGAGVLALASCGLAAALALRTNAFHTGSALPPVRPAAAMPSDTLELPALATHDWSRFRGRVGASPAATGALGQRFRLAGTFFEFTSEGQDIRTAILDDLSTGQQQMVRERDVMADVVVLQIQRDRVRLRDGAGQEVDLLLTFTGGDRAVPADGEGGAAADGTPAGRFGGTRMAENRWTFNRATLLRYYQDLRDQPERLVQLFDSLKPVYTDDNRITGYQLDVEGEREFFEAVGLEPGDVVRKVNNVEMTNRRRAEFFVSQFVRDESNAFVLDVERGGSTNRLVYEVR